MMTETKICTCCKMPKSKKRFRWRTKKGYTYQQGKCIDCENAEQKIRYDSKKDNIDFKIKNRQRVKNYQRENWDVVQEKNKKRRQTKRYKENRRKYTLKNYDKISRDHKIRAKKWFEKNRDELSDSYVVSKIIGKTKVSPDEVRREPELIEIKRMQLKLGRVIKNKLYEKQSRGA